MVMDPPSLGAEGRRGRLVREGCTVAIAGRPNRLPLLSRSQAGVLLEVMKDMFYQCFVRRGKLTRAIKVRQFFVKESNGGLRPSA